MRIGLTAAGSTADKIVAQAVKAEEDGFSSLWFASAVQGDPLVAMALAGRATERIELGTSVLQIQACHPLLQANRAAAVAAAIGAPGRLTIGVGPSHRPVVEGVLGMPYDSPGRYTEEYVQILTELLNGNAVSFTGHDFNVHAGAPELVDGVPIPVLVGALAPRLLRVAGERAAGTVTWMANAVAIEQHVAPRIRRAAASAQRDQPRIVVGLPVAVHDDEREARTEAATLFGIYGQLPNYQRILTHGGLRSPEEAVIVGDESTVAANLEALFAAGATDVWAAPFAAGADKASSRARTRSLLQVLAAG